MLVKILPLFIRKAGSTPVSPRRVGLIDRVIADVGIEVEVVFAADGVGLQEPAFDRIIGPGLVVVKAHFRQADLPGVGETRAGPAVGLAIGAIGMDRLRGAGVVADADDRALAVHMQEPRRLRRVTGPLELEQGLVDPAAVDVTAQHIAPAVEFGDQIDPVIEILRHHPGGRGFRQPPQRVVFEAHGGRATDLGQAVFGVVAKAAATLTLVGEVTSPVIAPRQGGYRRILVETVVGTVLADVRARPVIDRVADRPRHRLAGWV